MSNTEIEKTITSKDLQFYVGLPCAIYELNADGTINKDIEPAPAHTEGVDVSLNKIIAERVNYEPQQIKPILKNIEEITLEDVVHISCDIMGYDRETPEKEKGWLEDDLNDIKEFGFFQFEKHDSIFMPSVILYLIKQGYNLHLLPHGSYLIYNKNGRAFESNEIK